MSTLYGFKKGQTQAFDSDGHRVPVTLVSVSPMTIVGQKTEDKNGYNAWQVALGNKKHPSKSLQGLLKNITEKITPKYIREVRISEAGDKKIGDAISITDILAAGDKIDVTGVSAGKGFAGVVKRHGFKGSPMTHGTSNRQRHGGSIGQTTTPGRVYKNKRMAGHMGSETITLKNLQVFETKAEENIVAVRGLVPGKVGTLLRIVKVS